MSARAAITTPDLVVLSLLSERPFHGYELNLELERRDVRDWAGISRPQVYYSLAKLATRGLVEAVAGDDEGHGPERDVFAITPSGRKALREELARSRWAEQRPAPPFLTWMALSTHAAPKTVREQLARRKRFLRVELTRERKTLIEFAGHSGYPFDAACLMVTLTIRHFEAELQWLDEATRRLARYTGASR